MPLAPALSPGSGAKSSDMLATRLMQNTTSPDAPRGRHDVQRLTKSPGDLQRYLETLGPAARATITYEVEHGEVFFVEDPFIAESTMEELLHDTFLQDPGPVVRGLFKARILIGKALGLDKQPTKEELESAWSSPEKEVKVGQHVFIFEVVHLDRDRSEVMLHAKNDFEDCYISLKRDGDRLYMGSFNDPIGLMGQAYWLAITPFHGVVVDMFLDNAGSNARQRLASEQP